MNTFALKTTLSALIVAVPVSGAFADNIRGDAPDFLSSSIDRTHTSSTGSAVHQKSYSQLLDAQIAAAQTNLQPDRDGFVDPAAAARAQAQLLTIRQVAKAAGGALSEGEYQSLASQLRAVQETIREANNG